MSIEHKLAYRKWLNGSFEWETVRLLCLYLQRKCHGCGVESKSNQAHHIFYRENWNKTKMYDLRLLCDKCHKEIHKRTTPNTYKNRGVAEYAFKRAINVMRKRNGLKPHFNKKTLVPL